MKKFFATKGQGYYARNDVDVKFDNWVRSNVMDGSKAEMALYVQNQEILSMLRRIDEKISLPCMMR
jgi:hypothetical protein